MTQKQEILKVLRAGRMITPIDALNDFGCFRLGGRILELRQDGYDIRTVINDGNKKYAKYYLIAPGVRRCF